jgi:hypothetical protein
MPHRIISAVLIALFGSLLYFIVKDSLHLVDGGQYGELPLLLFCGSVCVGWIAFLGALALAGVPASRANWDRSLSHA